MLLMLLLLLLIVPDRPQYNSLPLSTFKSSQFLFSYCFLKQ